MVRTTGDTGTRTCWSRHNGHTRTRRRDRRPFPVDIVVRRPLIGLPDAVRAAVGGGWFPAHRPVLDRFGHLSLWHLAVMLPGLIPEHLARVAELDTVMRR